MDQSNFKPEPWQEAFLRGELRMPTPDEVYVASRRYAREVAHVVALLLDADR